MKNTQTPRVMMIGKKFGRLTVSALIDEKRDGSRQFWYKCLCDCGSEIEVRGTSLRNGDTKSCGCLRTEMLRKRNIDSAAIKYNLLGRRFHRLVVQELLNHHKHGQRIWRCYCDCGNIHDVTTHNLIANTVKSCGCLPTNTPVDISGKRYSLLIAIKVTSEKKSNGGSVWLCRCDCGEEVCVPAGNLKRGTTNSCGCIRRDYIVGKKFGKLTVEELGKRSGFGNGSFWICTCECGNRCEVQASKLKNGHTRSCGCSHNDLKNNLAGKQFEKLKVLEDSGERSRSGSIIWKCKCKCGEIKLIRQDALVSGKTISCGCIISKGNAKIANILKSNKIKYIPEYSPKDLEGRYRFDFAIIANNNEIDYFIEYDGELHYSYNGKGWNTEKRYQSTLQSDKIKNEYCINKKISLIRIPYTVYNKLSLNDLLLDMSNYIFMNAEKSN